MKKWLLLPLFVSVCCVQAQTKADVFDEKNEITWLGLDFTQVKFIGSAAQWGDAGEINNEQLQEKYFPSWNQLFINEPKKFDVAGAVNRSEVGYAPEITEKANKAVKGKNFFSENMDDYSLLTEEKIVALVKKYDFSGKSGIGLLFFVEGMSKAKEEASMWVTFVDMKSKKVLYTVRQTGKSGGFGFRNYWAKPFALVLKDMKGNYKKWKKNS